jgi:hypothetical protein
MLGMMSKGDMLNFSLPEGGHKIELAFNKYHYSITLLDVNTIRKDPNPPTIELPGKLIISGEIAHFNIAALHFLDRGYLFPVVRPDLYEVLLYYALFFSLLYVGRKTVRALLPSIWRVRNWPSIHEATLNVTL